jgi:hypothetical protein
MIVRTLTDNATGHDPEPAASRQPRNLAVDWSEFLPHILDVLGFRISAQRPRDSEGFRGFLHSTQACVGIVPQLAPRSLACSHGFANSYPLIVVSYGVSYLYLK